MALRDTVPIAVGVTGHRDIRTEDRGVLREAVEKQLLALREKCPHSGIVMLNSLAAGADQLCAEAALKLSIPLIAVLPMAQEEYEKDFSEEELLRFRSLCSAAEACFTAPETEQPPLSPDRNFAYRQAGIWVAAHSHVLLALWDGKTEGVSENGTAGTVKAALQGENAVSAGYTWKSSSTKIATVSATGVVKGVKAGTATITVEDKTSHLSATYKVLVCAKPATKVIISGTKTASLDAGVTELQLTAKVTPTNQPVAWSSSDTKTATVDVNGKVTALKAGTVKITATALDGSGVKATATVKFTRKATAIVSTNLGEGNRHRHHRGRGEGRQGRRNHHHDRER